MVNSVGNEHAIWYNIHVNELSVLVAPYIFFKNIENVNI